MTDNIKDMYIPTLEAIRCIENKKCFKIHKNKSRLNVKTRRDCPGKQCLKVKNWSENVCTKQKKIRNSIGLFRFIALWYILFV